MLLALLKPPVLFAGSHVEVAFEDGSHAKGKLVLGADGYFSKVREHCLGDGPPDFAVSLPGS